MEEIGATHNAFSFSDVMPDDDDSQAAEEPEPKKRKLNWEICGMPSRNHEADELFVPSLDRSTCFGCVYVGERDKTTLGFEQVTQLINMIRESVARCDPVSLARHVAKQYKALRREINNNLMEGEPPLQRWTAPMILDHIRNHNTDPELQTWIRLTEIQEIMQIALRSMVEESDDPERRDKRINPQQFRVYQDAVKLYSTVMKTDVTKCTFKSNEALIDMKAACQPIVALGDKKIVDYFDRL